MTATQTGDPKVDDPVEGELLALTVSDSPRSFMLYAGAGSGKTRSLTALVMNTLEARAESLALRGQTIAVITYTNAAAGEVAARLPTNTLVEVSTIHAFAWRLISPYQADIRTWMRAFATRRIAELEAKPSRQGTKAEDERVRKLARYTRRLEELDTIARFVYSPTGDNRTRESLSHYDVLTIASEFMTSKPVFQQLVANRHPVILVDESQDTNVGMMDALLALEALPGGPLIGLFGDTMQRIYNDGKADLETAIPQAWARPAKRMNHRSRVRIVGLANSVRREVDGHLQLARDDMPGGIVRLFVTGNEAGGQLVEHGVRARMMAITEDPRWMDAGGETKAPAVKHLILEHHMASLRFGFAQMFDPLYALDRHREGLLDGTFRGLRELRLQLIPIVDAIRADDRFAIARQVRANSKLLSDDALNMAAAEGDGVAAVVSSRSAVAAVESLLSQDSPSLGDLVRTVVETGLISMPEVVVSALAAPADGEDAEVTAWRQTFTASYVELERWDEYVRDLSPFATQQGVKGLEFPHVLTVLSDRDARGFLFSYDQLFGLKAASAGSSSDSVVDRTRRLFYVACTRGIESVAVLLHASEPQVAIDSAVQRGWFTADECEVIA